MKLTKKKYKKIQLLVIRGIREFDLMDCMRWDPDNQKWVVEFGFSDSISEEDLGLDKK